MLMNGIQIMMTTMRVWLVTVSVALLCAPLGLMAAQPAAGPEKGSKAETAPKSWAFTPDPALPNVLILGDSISIGYTHDVRALLAGKANVYRPLSPDGRMADNCSGTTKGIVSIDHWLEGHSWKVIHFNFGLHDMKHVAAPGDDAATSRPSDPRQASPEQYKKNLETIVQKLKATGAHLIFATTTPVVPGTLNPLREPEAPALYNKAALEVMARHGIEVDDLYALSLPQIARIQLPKNVHFTPEGSRVLAGQVAKVIEKALERTRPQRSK